MKLKLKWAGILSVSTVAVILGGLLSGCDSSTGGSMGGASMVADAGDAGPALSKDPAWQPSCQEVGIIRVGQKGGGKLHNFCVNLDGNLLACYGGFSEGAAAAQPRGAGEPPEIRVYSPEGALLKSWSLEKQPQAICVSRDGSIFVGGEGRVSKLNQEGKVLATADSPVAAQQVKLSAEVVSQMKSSGRGNEQELEQYKRSLAGRKSTVTGIAATEQDVFVVCPSPSDFTFRVYRFDHDLKQAKLVVEGLRGCCGQMDLQAGEDRIWIPHNARHRVECRDRGGKEIGAFGKHDRQAADGFGGCCEPKNLRVVGKEVFTAESGPPVAIKRFSQDGKFLGVVAVPSFPTSCVRVTVDVSPDHTRWYILDTGQDSIHMFAAKRETAGL